jgi:hypothetical protein
MRNLVTDTYEQLHEKKLVSSQYEFSRCWLSKSDGYYGFLKSSREAEPSAAVLLSLWAACRKQHQVWQRATQQNLNDAAYAHFKGLAETTQEIEQHVGDTVMAEYFIEPTL